MPNKRFQQYFLYLQIQIRTLSAVQQVEGHLSSLRLHAEQLVSTGCHFVKEVTLRTTKINETDARALISQRLYFGDKL